MTKQDNVIPQETDIMLRLIDDWISRHPTILEKEGFPNIASTDSKSSVPFNDNSVTHSIITVTMPFTRLYK